MIVRHEVSRAFPVGRSAAIDGLNQLMRQVAGYDSTVLIRGESGTGKELVARAHSRAFRAVARAVRAGQLRRDSARPARERAVRPRERRVHGRVTTRIGRFELADGGTLFLDEIGDMRFDMQVKLLRVLQERAFERVGSGEQRRANVRILAATHRDLETRVARGEFREDLFFRLNVFPIVVPPLARARRRSACADRRSRAPRRSRRPAPRSRFTRTALDCLRPTRGPATCASCRISSSASRSCIRIRRSIATNSPRRSASGAATRSPRSRPYRPGARPARAPRQHREAAHPQRARADRRHRGARRAAPQASANDARREAAQVRAARARLSGVSATFFGATTMHAGPSIRRLSSPSPSTN